MGLFFSSKKPVISQGNSVHLSNQHGSMKNEINKKEFVQGIHHDIHSKFSGREREVITKLLEENFDNSSTNHRHVIDKDEMEKVIDDVSTIYSKSHGDTLRTILEKRM